MSDLVRKFDAAMFDLYRRAKVEAKYNAVGFLQMITDRGGLATAKALINATKVSDGYTALYERGRLDLTLEAFITEDSRWHSLFSEEELNRATRRLTSYRYKFKNNPPALS